MAFASFDRRDGSVPISDINMVPLIDVMLVMLVIFIVTAPLLTHAVRLELPRADTRGEPVTPQRIEFAIDASGTRYWNGETVSREQAARRFVEQGVQRPQPEIHLRADRTVAYQLVAETIADAAKAGLGRVAFVSDPRPD